MFLPGDSHNLRGYATEAEWILGESKEHVEFTLEPNAWMEAFGVTGPKDQERINKRIVERVRTIEERAKPAREREQTRVIGREKLLYQVLVPTTGQNAMGGACSAH